MYIIIIAIYSVIHQSCSPNRHKLGSSIFIILGPFLQIINNNDYNLKSPIAPISYKPITTRALLRTIRTNFDFDTSTISEKLSTAEVPKLFIVRPILRIF